MSAQVGGVLTAVGAIGLVIGILGAFGIVPGLAVTCVSNCGTGITPSFSVSKNGYAIYLNDTSHWANSADRNGYLTLSVNWGDSTPASAFTPPNNQLPISHMFEHVYVAAGTYTVAETIAHEQCAGGRGGVHCKTTDIVAQGQFAISGIGGQNKYVPGFTYTTATGNVVNVKDTSTTYGSPTLTSIKFVWGDGSTNSPTALGFSLSHTYAAAGNYTATETISWTYVGEPFSAPFSTTIPVGCSSCTNVVTVNVDFSTSFVNYTLAVKDTSTTVGSPTVTGLALAWGDGQTGSAKALGANFTHTYSTYGNYSLTETVSWTYSGNSYSATSNATVSLPCFGTCGTKTNTTTNSTFSFNLVTGVLIVGFGTLALLGFLVMRFPVYGTVIILVMFALGGAIGYVVGGL